MVTMAQWQVGLIVLLTFAFTALAIGLMVWDEWKDSDFQRYYRIGKALAEAHEQVDDILLDAQAQMSSIAGKRSKRAKRATNADARAG